MSWTGTKLQRVRVQPPVPEDLRPLCVGTPEHDAWLASIPDEDYGEAYWFWCPGCDTNHRYTTRLAKGEKGPCWTFNGNEGAPTFRASLLYNASRPDPERGIHRCHLWLTDGRIQFLGDCTHGLKGKTVAMVPFP